MSLFVQTIKLRQFVCTPWPENSRVTLGEARRPLSLVENSAWLEAAVVQLGPIVTDISGATSKPEFHLEQKDFLEMHDAKFQRLWFLWQPQDQLPGKLHGVCGCTGGCNFFGKNVNGPRFFTAEKLDASENDTGMDGFGSETGFYDDGDIVDSGARPLMYSRSADLNALGSNYFDRTPVGSIEAFTRRRYTASGSEGSSPKVRRSMQTQTNKEAYIELGIGKSWTHLLFLTRCFFNRVRDGNNYYAVMENHRKLGRGKVIIREISCTGEVLALKCIEVRKEAFPKSILTFRSQL